MPHLFPILLLISSLALSSVTSARAAETAGHPGRPWFDRGVEAFSNGEDELARDHLEQARATGLESAALSYNLGVVYYRLEQYSRAAAEFRTLLDTPHRDLANYNLGLVALAQDDPPGARQHFSAVSDEAESAKLRRLAWQQLGRLADPAPGIASVLVPRGNLVIGSGFDSNVELLPDTAGSGDGEEFIDGLAQVEVDVPLPAGPGQWYWDGLLYRQYFPSATDFNLTLAETGVHWRAGSGDLVWHSGPYTSHWWLAGERVESGYGLRFALDHNACGWLGRCHGRLDVAKMAGGTDYPEYDGWQYDAEAGITRPQLGGVLGIWLTLALADRDDIRTETLDWRVSPFRQALDIIWRTSLSHNLTTTARTQFRHSDYQGDFRWQTMDGEVTAGREDDRWMAALALEWSAGQGWYLTGEGRYEDNSSSLEGYDYQRHSLWVGLEKAF